MSAAMQAVFGTAELLEDILIQGLISGISQHELLIAQRVSRSFNTVVSESPTLQKLLYFRAATTLEDIGFLHTLALQEGTLLQSTYHDESSAWRSRVLDGLCNDGKYQSFQLKSPRNSGKWDHAKQRWLFERLNNDYAPAHRMFTSQPPPTMVTVHYYQCGWRPIIFDHPEPHADFVSGNEKVRKPTGAAAGHVFRAAMRVVVPVNNTLKFSAQAPYEFDQEEKDMKALMGEVPKDESDDDDYYYDYVDDDDRDDAGADSDDSVWERIRDRRAREGANSEC